MNHMEAHNEKILDQFTKQASLFQSTHRSEQEAIDHAIRASGVTSEDVVLDVACGPGVLTCAFAKRSKHVTGIDITPTMLEQARELQKSSGTDNISWQLGDVCRMPFESGAFSMIITRYSFHHFQNPCAVLKEMVRVCKEGGVIMVIDSAPPSERADAFNRMEYMRDPSHTKALTREELLGMLKEEEVHLERTHLYAWEVTAESLLARSFPEDGDRMRLMKIYEDDVGRDALAMNARYVDSKLHVTFPTLIAIGRKRT
jgi:ubiquinone/menaquinone biosynthesis C-methylase UbiE